MKPLHIALLAAGAVVAGGLAFKMTQPPPVAVIAPAVPSPPAPPPAEHFTETKPSPVPPVPAVQPAKPVRAIAPDPVYDEAPQTANRKHEAKLPRSASRKNKPILTANLKPLQWVPGKYESPDPPGKTTAGEPAPAHSVATAVAEKSPASAVVPAVEKKTVPTSLHQATLPSGMILVIRLSEPLSSDYTPTGGSFAAALAEPLIADGFVIAEPGARVTGRILDSEKAGRSTGTSRLRLALTNVRTSDGQQIAISTEPWLKLGDNVPSESVIAFRLKTRVTITEQPVR